MFSDDIAILFTNSEQESFDVTPVLDVIPIMSILSLINVCQAFFLGLVRALGIQAKVVWVFFVSLYIVALPIGYYLTFECGLGIRGLFMGQFPGLATQILIFAILTLKLIDW